MTLSLYDVSVPSFIHNLKSLADFLKIGETHFAGNEQALLDSRLIADMENLPFQIKLLSSAAERVAVLVGHAEPAVTENNEKTFPELYERIQKTIDVLEKLDPKCMDGMEDKEVILKMRATDRKFTGKNFVLGFAVPNFYFHFCMAYALLRKEGVPIGKMDYLGAKKAA